MRNLILLFRKFGSLILFIFLEVVCFVLIINFNNKQRDIFLYSSNLFSGTITDKYNEGLNYFRLRSLNDSIAQENADLLRKLYLLQNSDRTVNAKTDSNTHYSFIPAKISNKTINLRNNRITLNKGKNDGILPGMAVLSKDGIIGMVTKSNEKFASVMPILNTQMQVSVKIKTKNYFGDLVWEPYDERFMLLKHVPKHAQVAVGDTVVTSGYSTVFPNEIPVGTIRDIVLPAGSNYFDIRVKLNHLISNLEYVYVVKNDFTVLQQEMVNNN